MRIVRRDERALVIDGATLWIALLCVLMMPEPPAAPVLPAF